MTTDRKQFFKHTEPSKVQATVKTHGSLMLFAGSGNPDLAEEISACDGAPRPRRAHAGPPQWPT